MSNVTSTCFACKIGYGHEAIYVILDTKKAKASWKLDDEDTLYLSSEGAFYVVSKPEGAYTLTPEEACECLCIHGIPIDDTLAEALESITQ
jgi:hypothetical protein